MFFLQVASSILLPNEKMEDDSLTLEQIKAQKLEKLQRNLQDAWVKLQHHVNCLYDANHNPSRKRLLGIKQVK